MFCTQCGTELPVNANFCSNCGLQLNENVQRLETTRTQWEYCDITWEKVSPAKSGLFSGKEGGTARFWARGVGSKGMFIAGESVSTWPSHPDYPHNDPDMNSSYNGKAVRAAFYELVAELLKEGWEPYWERYEFDSRRWQKTFKRPVILEY